MSSVFHSMVQIFLMLAFTYNSDVRELPCDGLPAFNPTCSSVHVIFSLELNTHYDCQHAFAGMTGEVDGLFSIESIVKIWRVHCGCIILFFNSCYIYL